MSSGAERFHFDDRFEHITTSMANSVIDAAYAAGQEAERERIEEALRRQRHDDQRVWLEAFLPLLPEDKREQYREQIRIAQAAESLTSKENEQ